MRITTLILSFLAFIFILALAPIARAEQPSIPDPEFSVSFNVAHANSGEKYEKKYSAVESGTSTILIVSNAIVSLLRDNDGDEYYPKLTCKFDLDANKTINYYAISYLDFNDGYGWLMVDESSVYILDEGYSPEEGILDLDIYFFSGYGRMEVNVKVEVYYTDGSLAASYGPDDDPDLKNIPAESADYDTKGDPFVNYTPTPTPTPTPNPQIIGHVVDKDDNDISDAKVTLKKNGEVITTASSDENGEFVFSVENPGQGIHTSYDLIVTKKGYRRKFVSVPVVGGEKEIKVTIKLKKR